MGAFLQGFAKSTGMSQQEASEQWDAFSRMLSNKQIQRIEKGGYSSGVREGKQFRKLYPEEEENPASIHGQIRRLPTGQIQLKIPLKSNPVLFEDVEGKPLNKRITKVARYGEHMLRGGGLNVGEIAQRLRGVLGKVMDHATITVDDGKGNRAYNPRACNAGVRQTSCRYCGQDIENFYPYKRGEWRDRGNNTHCPDNSGRLHAPFIESSKDGRAYNPQDKYEVIVGNIGTAMTGNSKAAALKYYNQQVWASKHGHGRSRGESVTLMKDGEPVKEHFGTQGEYENPSRGSADLSAARELELFIENDSALYRQQYQPILKNLATKRARGIYDHAKAVKLFMYLMESGAKKYAKGFGGPGANWHEMFNVPTRQAAAEAFTKSFEVEDDLGNYSDMLPKKYQKKANPGGDAYWAYPWVVIVKSASGTDTALSKGFTKEPPARKYIGQLKSRGLHLGRYLQLIHSTPTVPSKVVWDHLY